jgi:hypothetical protein
LGKYTQNPNFSFNAHKILGNFFAIKVRHIFKTFILYSPLCFVSFWCLFLFSVDCFLPSFKRVPTHSPFKAQPSIHPPKANLLHRLFLFKPARFVIYTFAPIQNAVPAAAPLNQIQDLEKIGHHQRAVINIARKRRFFLVRV